MVRNDETPAVWESLPEWAGEIDPSDQVLFIAMTGGAKSTLAATLTLPVPSLIAVDDKGRLTLPRALVFDLPAYKDDAQYRDAVASAIRWRDGAGTSLGRFFSDDAATNRIILRVAPDDQDNAKVHNLIFRGIFLERPDTIVWIDEITATGATPQSSPVFLRSMSARGRTNGIGLWTLTQAPYGMLPGFIKRNATITIVGPVSRGDAREMLADGFDHADIAADLPTKQGKFIVRIQGDRQTYRLYLPIPPQLKGWTAP